MGNECRTKEELIEELCRLRSRVAEFETVLDTGKKESAFAKDDDLLCKVHFLQTLIDTIPSPIFYKDTVGRFLGCNRAFESAMGLSRKDIIGKTVYDLAPKELADKYFEMDTALFRGQGIQCFETSVRYSDGSIRDVILNKAAYAGPENKTAGLVGAFTDITEHKRAEDQMRRSEERYRTLFEESLDGIFVSTPSGEITELNPAGLKMFGFGSNEELQEIKHGEDLYENPLDRKRFVSEIEQKGFVRDFKVNAKRTNGKKMTLSITASTVKDSEGKVTAFRGFIRDITSQIELEQQLIQAQKMDAVGKLTGGIAHDFNNMVMALIGYATLLQMKLKEDDPLLEHVKHILGVTDRAANLTKRLLAFSRKQIMTLKKEDLNAIVEKAGILLGRLIGEHIEFRTDLADEDFTVMADSGQIEQVLINLATNARDAMHDGGVLTISTGAVELDDGFIEAHSFGERGRFACIKVEDTGTGMDAETKARIFDPFFTTKDVGKGTGLGLSIVYGIIKQHNGYISVSTEPGKGSSFKVYLPALRHKAEEKTFLLAASDSPLSGKETVLIAEDDSEVRKITRTVLEDYGYDVREAVDGEDAIGKFMKDRDKIKLVVLDVVMPRKNGWEAYDEIIRISPGVKAIFLSGYNQEMIQRKGVNDATLNFISKPVWPSEFLRKVREVLNALREVSSEEGIDN